MERETTQTVYNVESLECPRCGSFDLETNDEHSDLINSIFASDCGECGLFVIHEIAQVEYNVSWNDEDKDTRTEEEIR